MSSKTVGELRGGVIGFGQSRRLTVPPPSGERFRMCQVGVARPREATFGGVTKAQTKRRNFRAWGVKRKRTCFARRKNETTGVLRSTDGFFRAQSSRLHAAVDCHCPVGGKEQSARHAGHRQDRLQRQKCRVFLSAAQRDTKAVLVELSPLSGTLC